MPLPYRTAAALPALLKRALAEPNGAETIRERIDVVTRNVYRLLPSGDYGRGDVRAAILEHVREWEESQNAGEIAASVLRADD